MAVEIGSTVEGTVVKLADYGAVVRLAGGKVGLVHISEIADTYVRDVRDYFSENDRIYVKVLKLNDKGRYELSAKQVDQNLVLQDRVEPVRAPSSNREVHDHKYGSDRRTSDKPQSFEDRLNLFLKDSEERQVDIKRHVEAKRGGGRRR